MELLYGQKVYTKLIYSWKFLPNSACSHWFLRGHTTSNNETVSRQNLWAGNIAKSVTLEGNNVLLPANVDRRPLQQRGLINFHLYNKSLKDWSLARQLILFPSNLNVSSGPVIKCLMLHEYVESMWEILLMRKKPKSALLPPQRKI